MSQYRITTDADDAEGKTPPPVFKSQSHAYNMLEASVEQHGGSIEGAYLRRGILHIHGKFNGVQVRWRIEQVAEREAAE